MSRSFRSTTPALALLLVGMACSNKSQLPSLSVSVDPAKGTVQAGSFVTIKVTGTSNGTAFPDGMQPAPKLTTDYGSFEKRNPGSTDADDVQEKTDGTIVGHTETVKLYPDSSPGTANVVVSYADPFGNAVQATVQIIFKAVITTGEVKHLNFSCRSYNIGVLGIQDTSIQIPCNANATDSNDQVVTGAEIKFIAEAGTMLFDPETVGHPLVYEPSDPNALHAAPRDVDPTDLAGSVEPFRTSPDGVIHNPRDGLVTIMAYTPASKSYVVDDLALSEPYVDANDNQQFDDGENYVDLNNNGQWDEVQDDSEAVPHALWRKIKILWTGTLQNEPPVATVDPTFADLSYLQNQTFTISILDENYNVIAANDPANDVINWGYSPQPDVNPSPGQNTTTTLFSADDTRRLGMLMNANFDFIDPTSDFSWKLGGTKSFTVQNTMMCNTPLVVETFSVTGAVSRSLYLTAMGNPQGQQTENLIPAGGTIQPPPASMCTSN